jgi:dynein heavy chain
MSCFCIFQFPNSILQSGIKITNETPTGFKQNLLSLYLSDPVQKSEFFYGCKDMKKTYTKLIYAMCLFHAVVQERRKFGSIGWNIPYNFSESDFHISIKLLQQVFQK